MICAVIITFHPDRRKLDALLSALKGQVDEIKIIDNTQRNVGIGAAQNVGIRYAIDSGFDYVILFDQDSVPSANMVAWLIREIDALRSLGKRVAAIGPNHIVGGRPSIPLETSCREVSILNSSGMLIPIEAVKDIGLVNEELFIDLVDIEWLMRARSKGWHAYQSSEVTMHHELGRGAFRIWAGKWYYVPKHPPSRLYYFARNTVYLCLRSSYYDRWSAASPKRVVIRFIAYCFQWRHCAMMFKGLYHGFIGRLGPLAD